MHFSRDYRISTVLESSSTLKYTVVLRAVLPRTHEKITIFRDAQMSELAEFEID
ncbi:MAG: hypothetical protein ACI8XC_002694 [Gammaproteobacteria bacterium]|jgi:hypothetical protein